MDALVTNVTLGLNFGYYAGAAMFGAFSLFVLFLAASVIAASIVEAVYSAITAVPAKLRDRKVRRAELKAANDQVDMATDKELAAISRKISRKINGGNRSSARRTSKPTKAAKPTPRRKAA
jgi:hypothetical protein